jgi:hypothetical protein
MPNPSEHPLWPDFVEFCKKEFGGKPTEQVFSPEWMSFKAGWDLAVARFRGMTQTKELVANPKPS